MSTKIKDPEEKRFTEETLVLLARKAKEYKRGYPYEDPQDRIREYYRHVLSIVSDYILFNGEPPIYNPRTHGAAFCKLERSFREQHFKELCRFTDDRHKVRLILSMLLKSITEVFIKAIFLEKSKSEKPEKVS